MYDWFAPLTLLFHSVLVIFRPRLGGDPVISHSMHPITLPRLALFSPRQSLIRVMPDRDGLAKVNSGFPICRPDPAVEPKDSSDATTKRFHTGRAIGRDGHHRHSCRGGRRVR